MTDDQAAHDEHECGYEPFIAAEGWREDTSIRYVPESEVEKARAQGAATERERIRQAVRARLSPPYTSRDILDLLDGTP